MTMHVHEVLLRLSTNWKSGLTVALVSIPLSVSLAVASQSTPTAGIITAIWAGLLAALFGGSHYNVVGPTGALSGILAAYALGHGAGLLPLLAILAGVFIFVAYLFRLERFLVFVPANTIHGFTLGVAVIIAGNQLNFAFGLSGLTQHEHFFQNMLETFAHLGDLSLTAVCYFVIALVILLILAKTSPKLPGAILIAPLGILLGYAAHAGWVQVPLVTLGDKFPDISAKLFQMPEWSLSPTLIVPAITVALVAILETMISAKIADGMTKTKHDKRKEMFGLGLANIGSGLMGGIPATAALARTSLNIKTGAGHRTSAIVSSISIALISLLLLTSFRFIPLTIIAAILVFVAIRMVEKEHFYRMWKSDRKGLVLSLVVAFVTIYEDPIIGIIFGTAISLLIFVEKLSRGQFDLVINDENKKIIDRISAEHLHEIKEKGDTIVYSIKGQLAYVNGASHVARFEQKLNGYGHVILRLRELYFVDLDGVDAFDEIVELIQGQGKDVLVTGVSPLVEKMLEESKAFMRLKETGHIYKRTSDALKSLGY